MHKLARAAALTMFIVGCVTGAVAREVFKVPAATAQVTDRFDHFCFYEGSVEDAVKKMNKAGADGFELVDNTQGFFCMKRRLH